MLDNQAFRYFRNVKKYTFFTLLFYTKKIPINNH
nr:MAG TPA: hypothetical protein [Caudoviricetes sp.]